MRTKLFVFAAVIAALAAALAGTGSAQAGPAVAKPGVKVFKTTVTPVGPSAGDVIVAKSTGAPKKTEFYCVLSAISIKDGKSLTASNTSQFKVIKSSKKGTMTCKLTYNPFSAKDENGKTRHCPPTKKDKKAGFKCAVAIADKATIGAVAASVGYFKPAA